MRKSNKSLVKEALKYENVRKKIKKKTGKKIERYYNKVKFKCKDD